MLHIRCQFLIVVFIGAAPCAAAADDSLDAARAAMQRNDLTGAIHILDGLIAKNAKDTAAYRLRASVYIAQHEPAKASADLDQVIRLEPTLAEAYNLRGMERFKLCRVVDSVADFDKFLALWPGNAPYHWQRGISLYYAGEYKKGAEQFESHQTVNSNDVENAVWHYLCNAKVIGPEKARAAFIKIASDRRVPLMTVHGLFAGRAKPEDVLKDAEAGTPSAARKKEQLFYAHLYLGLYYESAGDAKKSIEHMTKAATEFAFPHYMGDVARVHVQLRKTQP